MDFIQPKLQIQNSTGYGQSWTPSLWRKIALGITPVWINGLIALHEIAIEDFEYYAVYESGFLDLAVSFAMFKPLEWAIVVGTSLVVTKGAYNARSDRSSLSKVNIKSVVLKSFSSLKS